MQHQSRLTMSNIKNQSVTTDNIQTLLDVNKRLILAIMDHQNQGEFSKSAMFQVQLKKNLFFLAALSDAQVPPSEPGSPTQQFDAVDPPQDQQQFHSSDNSKPFEGT